MRTSPQEQEDEEKRKKLQEEELERVRKLKQAEEDRKKAEEEARLEKERQVKTRQEKKIYLLHPTPSWKKYPISKYPSLAPGYRLIICPRQ